MGCWRAWRPRSTGRCRGVGVVAGESGSVFLLLAALVVGFPAFLRAQAPQDAYLLGPGDTVYVVIFGEPDLSRTVTIKPDGTISLPLIGEVRAAGKTTTQLASELATPYR